MQPVSMINIPRKLELLIEREDMIAGRRELAEANSMIGSGEGSNG